MATKSDLNIQPLGNRVVVLPLKEGEVVSASGIIIPPTSAKEPPVKGKVVAVGPGSYDDGKLVPMTVKVGQTVVFSKTYEDVEIRIDLKTYYVLPETQIVAVIK